MGMFDNSAFNPQTYAGGMTSWLQDALRSGLLGRALPQQQDAQSPPTSMGSYGGIQYPIFGQPDTTTLSAQSQQAQPQQAPQPQMPPPQQPQPQAPQQPSFFGGLNNTLQNVAGILSPETGKQLQEIKSRAPMRQALIDAGAPANVADAAAANPTILAQVGPRYLGENFKIVPYGATAINQKGEVLFQNNSGSATLDQPTIEAMAHQYRAGDTTVMQNLGRGVQGAENIVKVRAEIAKQNAAEGTSGEGQAMRNAEFFGVKSGQRTLGTRQANIDLAATELKQVIPVVMAASEGVDRTNYPDLNRVIQAFQRGTGDPNIVKLGSGVNTLVNLYSRAISPTGQPTVSDKDHAREILNQAWAKGQFNAAVQMMEQEVNAASSSPAAVRGQMRGTFLGGMGPMTNAPQAPETPFQQPVPQAPAAKAAPPAPPKIDTVKDGYRFRGGDPSDPKNWVKTL